MNIKSFDKEAFPKWLLAIMVVFACSMTAWQWGVCGSMGMLGDYFDYLGAWENLQHLHPHISRPPVYPLILGTSYGLFGETAGQFFLVLLNWTAWIIGSLLTWKIMSYLKVRRGFRIAVFIALMLFSGSWVYNNNLLPEALVQGLIPLQIWTFIKFLRTKRTIWILYSVLTALSLLFIKPQFICLYPVLTVFWVIVTFRNRHQLFAAICLTVLSGCVIGAYSLVLNHFYSLSGSISISTYWNRYCTLRMAGLIRIDEIRDPQARQALTPFILVDSGQYKPEFFMYEYEIQYLSVEQLIGTVDDAIKKHPAESARAFTKPIYAELDRPFFPRNWHERQYVTETDRNYYELLGWKYNGDDIRGFRYGKELFMPSPEFKGSAISPSYELSFPFWVSWLVIILFTLLYAAGWLRSHRFPVIAFLIAGTLSAGYVTAFIGAMGDWGRLVNPYTMLLFCAAAAILSSLYETVKSETERLSNKNNNISPESGK